MISKSGGVELPLPKFRVSCDHHNPPPCLAPVATTVEQIDRGKWGNVKQNFSSVSQGVDIANMAIFMY